MKKSDRIGKAIAILLFILFLVTWSILVNAQSPNKDTIVYNQFRDYVEWSKQQHKKTLEDFENEKYQMIYIDKAIIDRKSHRIYLYSSYDLYWADENGIGLQIAIPTHRKKLITKKQPKPKKW